MGLHQLHSTDSESKKRVGRGGKRGKTSGRGTKGQKARAGGTPRPAIRDVIKKIPKLRGHGVNRARTFNPDKPVVQAITIEKIAESFTDGAAVNPQTLYEAGLLARGITNVKIIGNQVLELKLRFADVQVSEGAKKAIEASGSTIG